MHPDLTLCYRLLPLVSRTFALNIRILPGELRPAVTTAYLLFRIADTIEDGATGILFEPLAPDALVAAVERAVAMLRKEGFAAVQRRLLSLDVSWAEPAEEWERVLAAVVREAARRV